jgi:hypothetical protein
MPIKKQWLVKIFTFLPFQPKRVFYENDASTQYFRVDHKAGRLDRPYSGLKPPWSMNFILDYQYLHLVLIRHPIDILHYTYRHSIPITIKI